MANSLKYQLSGYIEYLPMRIGFVTPVFQFEGKFYVQISQEGDIVASFQELLPELQPTVTAIKVAMNVQVHSPTIFGFKFFDEVYFHHATEMEEVLSNKVNTNPGNLFKYEYEGIKRFLFRFSKANEECGLLLDSEKEFVWRRILLIIASQTKVFAQLFQKDFDVVSFENNVLKLFTRNMSLKDVFEKQFKMECEWQMIHLFPDFQITILNANEMQTEQKAPTVLPSKLERASKAGIDVNVEVMRNRSESNIMQEWEVFYEKQIQKVTQYIETGNNGKALIILGQAGMGKTHLLKTVAHTNKNIKRLIFFNCIREEAILRNGTDNLSVIINDYDVVILDDAHHFDSTVDFQNAYWRRIKELLDNGKQFILSYKHSPSDILMKKILAQGHDIIQLVPPTVEDTVSILRKKMIKNNLNIEQDVVRTIAQSRPASFIDVEKAFLNTYLISVMNEREPLITNKVVKVFLDASSAIRKRQAIEKQKQIKAIVFNYFSIDNAYCSSYPKDPKVINAELTTKFLTDIMIMNVELNNSNANGSRIKDSAYSFYEMKSAFYQDDNIRLLVGNIYKTIFEFWHKI